VSIQQRVDVLLALYLLEDQIQAKLYPQPLEHMISLLNKLFTNRFTKIRFAMEIFGGDPCQ
jgi:hypothetical protein